jgi:uncharacterized protein
MNVGSITFSAREPARLDWLKRPMSVAGDLPDVNVWLALAVEEHPHHRVAKAYWTEVQAGALTERNLWFCRTTMLGFVRLLAQPKVMGEGVLSLAQAMIVYQNFRAIPGVGLLVDAESTEQVLTRFTNDEELPYRFCTDAYLAALSESTGARLITFDSDFQRFKLSNWVRLKT